MGKSIKKRKGRTFERNTKKEQKEKKKEKRKLPKMVHGTGKPKAEEEDAEAKTGCEKTGKSLF